VLANVMWIKAVTICWRKLNKNYPNIFRVFFLQVHTSQLMHELADFTTGLLEYIAKCLHSVSIS